MQFASRQSTNEAPSIATELPNFVGLVAIVVDAMMIAADIGLLTNTYRLSDIRKELHEIFQKFQRIAVQSFQDISSESSFVQSSVYSNIVQRVDDDDIVKLNQHVNILHAIFNQVPTFLVEMNVLVATDANTIGAYKHTH